MLQKNHLIHPILAMFIKYILPVKTSWYEIISDTFNLVRFGFIIEGLWHSEDRSNRVNTDDLASRNLFLDGSSDSCKSTTSTSSSENVINFFISLIENFCSSAIVVSERIARVYVLIENVTVGDFSVEFQSLTNVTL